MKWLWTLTLLMLVLTGCWGNATLMNGGECNGGLCIKVEVNEPLRRGEPVVVQITVLTESDVPELGVSIFTYPPSVAVEGPAGWESVSKNGMLWDGGAGWLIDTEANHPVIFTRKIHVLSGEGTFEIQANATTSQGLRVSDTVRIYFNGEKGDAYRSGASMPVTHPPLLVYTITLGPSPTPIPTDTPWPTLERMPTQMPSPNPVVSPQSLLPAPTREAYP